MWVNMALSTISMDAVCIFNEVATTSRLGRLSDFIMPMDSTMFLLTSPCWVTLLRVLPPHHYHRQDSHHQFCSEEVIRKSSLRLWVSRALIMFTSWGSSDLRLRRGLSFFFFWIWSGWQNGNTKSGKVQKNKKKQKIGPNYCFFFSFYKSDSTGKLILQEAGCHLCQQSWATFMYIADKRKQ